MRIEPRWEEEGRQEVADEEELYAQLGLVEEESEASEGSDEEHPDDNDPGDSFPDERNLDYDKKNPVMKLGSIYRNMKNFRLAMRQYAINKQFELDLKKTNRRRYWAKCKGDKCNWSINAREEQPGVSIVIVCFFLCLFLSHFIYCMSMC